MTTPISTHVMNTYSRLPIAMSHGEGVWIWDTKGRKYLEALGGVAVNTLGHNHPRLVAALQHQVTQLIHCSNYYHQPMQEALGAKLAKLSGMTNAFFCSSGLEANEAALKIARKFGTDKGIERPEIVVFEGAFHGRSLATLAATGSAKAQQGFGPLVEGFIRVPLNDIKALEQATDGNSNVAAIMVEPIQGESGIHVVDEQFLRELRAMCDRRDWLLVLDEVQCGVGRTGKWFAHQWAGIVPDVMTLAKGLGSGVPIGAAVGGSRVANTFGPGNHGATFGGNPLATRAALETLRIMEEDDLLGNVFRMETHLRHMLESAFSDCHHVRGIRGKGLMLGIELDRPCVELMDTCAQAGLLVSVQATRVVRLVPPLILNMEEADQIVERLVPVVKAFLS